MLWYAFLPVLTQTVRYFKIGESGEELARQGLLMDETIYNTLRFSKGIMVSGTRISCYDKEGIRTGFSVKDGIMYRVLSNGQDQPLTGNPGSGIRKGRFVVMPYDERPYFAKEGQAVVVSVLLQDTLNGVAWPCCMTVVPLPQQWEI
jgi:hypothetical protein